MRNFLLGLAVGAVLFTGLSWATERLSVTVSDVLVPDGVYETITPAVQYVLAECYARNPETGKMEPISPISR